MTKDSKRLSFGLSLLVVCAILLSVTPVFAGVSAYYPETVDFTASPTSGYAPLTVEFRDLTEWPVEFAGFVSADGIRDVFVWTKIDDGEWVGTWDFGDGTTEQKHDLSPMADDPFDVSHVYMEPGTYTVSLTWERTVCAPVSVLPVIGFPAGTSQQINGATFKQTKHLYIEVVAPPEKKTKRPPEPANLALSNLVVSPTEVLPTQEVLITATVCNSGEQSGTMTVDLMINGIAEQSRTVGVSGGSCQPVTFTVARTHPGTYEVAVDGMPGQFSVIAPTNVPEVRIQNVPPQETGGIGTAGIIAIVAVLIVLIGAIFVILRKP